MWGSGEVQLDDLLGERVQLTGWGARHPLSQLWVIDSVHGLVLFLKVVFKDLLDVVRVAEDVVEHVGNDQDGQVEVEFVAALGVGFYQRAQGVKSGVRWLAVGLLERALEWGLGDLLVIGRPEFGVNHLNFAQTERTLIENLIKDHLTFGPILLRLFPDILELVGLAELPPGQVRVQLF